MFKLSARHYKIAQMLADGHSNQEIADAIGISIQTLIARERVNRITGKKRHAGPLTQLYAELGVNEASNKRAAAVAAAFRAGMVN